MRRTSKTSTSSVFAAPPSLASMLNSAHAAQVHRAAEEVVSRLQESDVDHLDYAHAEVSAHASLRILLS